MIERQDAWGRTSAGEQFGLFTLENEKLRARLTNMGATLVSLETADRQGQMSSIAVSYASPAQYETNPVYLGATVGRFANRIGKGQFWLDGRQFALTVNNGPNHLHGGVQGFSHRLWTAECAEDHVTFQLVSPDGEEGYPGRLTVSVTYRLQGETLSIEYSARADAATVVNLTNHTYWNLGGHGSILNHELQLFADQFLENDADVLPTGNIADVMGTPFDFRQPRRIGERIDQTAGGYDNCFVVRGWDGTPRPAARVVEPQSGRVMEIQTTAPGIQLYTGNFLDGTETSAGRGRHEAFCLECQHFPDSPNQPEFPSTALRPGEEYRQTTLHRFSVLD